MVPAFRPTALNPDEGRSLRSGPQGTWESRTTQLTVFQGISGLGWKPTGLFGCSGQVLVLHSHTRAGAPNLRVPRQRKYNSAFSLMFIQQVVLQLRCPVSRIAGTSERTARRRYLALYHIRTRNAVKVWDHSFESQRRNLVWN